MSSTASMTPPMANSNATTNVATTNAFAASRMTMDDTIETAVIAVKGETASFKRRAMVPINYNEVEEADDDSILDEIRTKKKKAMTTTTMTTMTTNSVIDSPCTRISEAKTRDKSKSGKAKLDEMYAMIDPNVISHAQEVSVYH